MMVVAGQPNGGCQVLGHLFDPNEFWWTKPDLTSDLFLVVVSCGGVGKRCFLLDIWS